MRYSYEWCIEWTDDYGDILDHDYEYSLADLLKHDESKVIEGSVCSRDICLVQNIGDNESGLQDRGYAYLTESGIDHEFCNGRKVPKRFIKESGIDSIR